MSEAEEQARANDTMLRLARMVPAVLLLIAAACVAVVFIRA